MVITEPALVEDALCKQFGLTLVELHGAIKRGETLRNGITEHHPRGSGGFFAYSEDTCALRDILVPRGGKADREDGVEKTITPSGQDAIAVMSGDSNTGNPDPAYSPQPKYPRGTGIQRSVQKSQLEFWPANVAHLYRGPNIWFLLLWRANKDLLLAELSLPEAIENEYVTKWADRIIIPPINVSPTPNVKKHAGFTGDVDIQIASKG